VADNDVGVERLALKRSATLALVWQLPEKLVCSLLLSLDLSERPASITIDRAQRPVAGKENVTDRRRASAGDSLLPCTR
jgi:hypothetical protein